MIGPLITIRRVVVQNLSSTPAAVTMASDIDRFSSDDARPTTANMTPNPVPAIPKPINNALI